MSTVVDRLTGGPCSDSGGGQLGLGAVAATFAIGHVIPNPAA